MDAQQQLWCLLERWTNSYMWPSKSSRKPAAFQNKKKPFDMCIGIGPHPRIKCDDVYFMACLRSLCQINAGGCDDSDLELRVWVTVRVVKILQLTISNVATAAVSMLSLCVSKFCTQKSPSDHLLICLQARLQAPSDHLLICNRHRPLSCKGKRLVTAMSPGQWQWTNARSKNHSGHGFESAPFQSKAWKPQLFSWIYVLQRTHSDKNCNICMQWTLCRQWEQTYIYYRVYI